MVGVVVTGLRQGGRDYWELKGREEREERPGQKGRRESWDF